MGTLQGSAVHLSTKEILETLSEIHTRVAERFPTSGLLKIVQELHDVGREAKERANWLAKPNYPLRISIGFFMFAVIFVTMVAMWSLQLDTKSVTLGDFVQMLSAATNELILLGGAAYLLWRLETRYKRLKILRVLHKLRAVAHIIDLHQLNKDPARLLPETKPTASSPKLGMDDYQLGRYLNYCSELLSIVSKIAAVYAQHFDDHVVLSVVREIESLCSGLSLKIWQKITVIGVQQIRN